MVMTPAEFAAHVEKEVAVNVALVKAADITPHLMTRRLLNACAPCACADRATIQGIKLTTLAGAAVAPRELVCGPGSRAGNMRRVRPRTAPRMQAISVEGPTRWSTTSQ
jgi:hypothetical protein